MTIDNYIIARESKVAFIINKWNTITAILAVKVSPIVIGIFVSLSLNDRVVYNWLVLAYRVYSKKSCNILILLPKRDKALIVFFGIALWNVKLVPFIYIKFAIMKLNKVVVVGFCRLRALEVVGDIAY